MFRGLFRDPNDRLATCRSREGAAGAKALHKEEPTWVRDRRGPASLENGEQADELGESKVKEVPGAERGGLRKPR